MADKHAAETPPVADSATSIEEESCPGPSPKSDGGSPGETRKPVLDVEAAAPENLEDFFDNVMFTPSNGICTPTYPHGHMAPPWAAAPQFLMDPAMMPMMYYPYMVPAVPMYYMPVPPPPPPPPKANNKGNDGKNEYHQKGAKPAAPHAMHGHAAAPPPPPPAHQPRQQRAQKGSGEREESATEAAAAKCIASDSNNESAGRSSANGAALGDGTAAHVQGAVTDGQEAVQGKEEAGKEGGAPAQGSDAPALPLLSSAAPDSHGDANLSVAEPRHASSNRRPTEKLNAINRDDGSTSLTAGSPGKPCPPVFEEAAFPALPGSSNTSNAGSTASTPGPNLPGGTQAPVWETAALAGVLKAPPTAAGRSTWGKGPAPVVAKPAVAEVKPFLAPTTTAALLNTASAGDEALQPSSKATPKPAATMPPATDAPPDAPKTPPQKDSDVAKEEITVAGVQYSWPTESLASSSRSRKGSNSKEQPLAMCGSATVSIPQTDLVSEGSVATAVDGHGGVGVLKNTVETLGAVGPEPAAEGKADLPTEEASIHTKKSKKKKKAGLAQGVQQGPADNDDQWISVTRGRRNR